MAMADVTSETGPHQVVCPHCKKTFTAELIVGETQRHRGFKCPHCKLFVPADRARATRH
jgi:transposase-like protein